MFNHFFQYSDSLFFKFKNSQHGFTLLELLICLGLLSAMLALGSPYLLELKYRLSLRSAMNTLEQDLNAAKSLALAKRSYIAFCPHHTEKCGHDWNNGWLYFVDSNQNSEFDKNEIALKHYQLASPIRLSHRSFGASTNLLFTPMGMLQNYTNGRFIGSFELNGMNYNQSITISRLGKITNQSK